MVDEMRVRESSLTRSLSSSFGTTSLVAWRMERRRYRKDYPRHVMAFRCSSSCPFLSFSPHKIKGENRIRMAEAEMVQLVILYLYLSPESPSLICRDEDGQIELVFSHFPRSF